MSVKLEVFTSKTCPHCPSAVAVSQKAKDQLGDELDFQHLDVDENFDKVMEYKIMSIPTIVIDGKVAFIGAPSEEELLQAIRKRQLNSD